MNANVAARLIERAKLHPEHTAIVEARRGRGRTITFGDLARRVEETAERMRRDGVGVGDRVLLFIPMSIDLYVALLATLHAGAVAVFVDAWADRKRLAAAVALASPRLLVAPAPVHLLLLLSPALRAIPTRWTITSARRTLSFDHAAPFEGPAELAADVPALITFTTGSTGTPKAAVRSHALLWAQHEALAEHLQLDRADVDMPTLPIFVLNNLALGITSVLPAFNPRRPARIRPARIVEQMRAHGVTTTSGSPAFYAKLAEWCEARSYSLDVRLWTGGAPVFPPLAGALDRLTGGLAHVVYGSTEAEPISGIGAGEMVRVMGGAPLEEGICCGRPVPQIDLRIAKPVDEPLILGAGGWEEWELPPGETGEILVAGEHVLGEYLHAPQETLRHKVRDGRRVWHRTGDAGRVDEEGRLWLMGRVSSRVQRAGTTWWSAPAELRALRVPGVRHAAFFGLEDDALGQRAVLVVESEASGDLRGKLTEALAPIPLDEIRVLKRIPRDPRHESKTDLERLRLIIGAPRSRKK